MSKVNQKTVKMVELALLAAIIIVLQTVFVIPLPGGLTLCLVLVPIVVGAVLYGPVAGAGLGAVFGTLVTFMVITGRMGLLPTEMWLHNPVMTIVICLLKGAAAGWVAGLLAKVASRKPFVGIVLASVAAPVVNTGLFVAGLFGCFPAVVAKFSQEQGVSAVYFVFIIVVGLNFLVEFAANVLLSPAVSSVVKAVKKST